MVKLLACLAGAGACLTSFVAAIAWMKAANKPVAMPAYTGYLGSDWQNDPGLKAAQAFGEEVKKGAGLNKKAATITAISAGFQCAAWLAAWIAGS